MGLGILWVLRKEDRTQKPAICLEASGSPKCRPGPGQGPVRTRQRVNMAEGCAPQLRAPSVDLGGPWEFCD